MKEIVRRNFRILKIDKKIKNMRIYGNVKNGKIFEVEESVEKSKLKCSGKGDRGLERLKIEMKEKILRERFKEREERIERIILEGKVNEEEKNEKLKKVEKREEFLLNIDKNKVEKDEIGILEIIMDNEEGDEVNEVLKIRKIKLEKKDERERRIGKIEDRWRKKGVEKKEEIDERRIVRKKIKLKDGIEDDIVWVRNKIIDIVIGIGKNIGMGLEEEFIMEKKKLVERGRSGEVNILDNKIKKRKCGKEIKWKKRIREGFIEKIGDILNVEIKFGIVDKIVGSMDNGRLRVVIWEKIMDKKRWIECMERE